jgi:hypothetical protein
MSNRTLSIEIPPEGREMLALLARVDDSFVDELETRLNASTPSLAKHELLNQLESIPVLAAESRLSLMLEMLISLAGSEYSSQALRKEVIEGVLEDLEESDDQNLSKAEEATLSKRLERLLASRCIELISRGTILRSSHTCIFKSVRIVSDFRPLFKDEGEGNQTISAALLSHDLSVRFTRNQRSENIFVTMASDDLLELRNAVERAIKKDQALRLFAAKSNTSIITPGME